MRVGALSVVLAVIAVSPGGWAQTAEPPAQGGPRPEAADLAARLQARYETVLDFTARFTQTYESGLLRMASSAPERGELKLKKPSRFRMVYTAPERKEFVADGRTLKCLTVIDEFTRECLAIDVAGGIRSGRVIEVLTQLVSLHGAPRHLRSDNGPEFVSRGGEKLAVDLQVPFLGRLPIYQPIREGSDVGVPLVVAEPDSAATRAFIGVAEQTAAQLSIASYTRPTIPLTPVS